MTGIMLAIAEGPLPIFPGLTPVNCRQGNQKPRPPAAEPGPALRPQVTPLFQGVLTRRIVPHAAVPNHVRLGGVQVAAGWIDAQRPAGVAVLLPGGEPERAAEKLRNAGVGNVVGGRGCVEQSGIRNVGRERRSRQFEEWRAAKTPEGIWLRRPVEMAGRPGEAVEGMLGELVVLERVGYLESSLIRRSSSAIA